MEKYRLVLWENKKWVIYLQEIHVDVTLNTPIYKKDEHEEYLVAWIETDWTNNKSSFYYMGSNLEVPEYITKKAWHFYKIRKLF